jgi:guanylate kinase
MADLSFASRQLIVFTGPSGVGKGTILRALLARHPELTLSVSATTRLPRPGEREGQHYYFLTRPQFEQRVREGAFLEWAEFASNLYGTLRQPVMQTIQQGARVILEIELEGARQVRLTAPEALQIFIQPPSEVVLEARIRQRGQDAEAAIIQRLARAQVEMASASEFDVQLVNDNLEETVTALESLLFTTPSSETETSGAVSSICSSGLA